MHGAPLPQPIPDSPGPRIGLLGGGFDPPHVAHVMVAAWALATGEIDELWAIPSGGHPFGKPMAPIQDRLEMTRRAFAIFGSRVRVLAAEREPRVHYSIDTLAEFERQYPENRWRWILGTDNLAEAHRWRDFEGLQRRAPLLLIPRAGCGAPADVPFALPNVSSTYIREQFREGRYDAVQSLVPAAVLDYIREHNLYAKS